METFTRDDLRRLAGIVSPACVSIYVPPRRAGSALRIDLTRMRNLARTARAALAERVGDAAIIDDVMRPIEALALDREAWRDPAHGVAIFRAPELFRTYRLPVDVPELVRVDTCFDLLPIVELAVDDGAYHILSIGRHDVRLYRATRQSLVEQSLGPTPVSFDEYLAGLEHRRAPQMHSASTAAAGGGGRHHGGTIYHDSSSRRERAKTEFEGFLRAIDRRVMTLVGPSPGPLVLAGVGAARALYRRVTAHSNVAPTGIAASSTTESLHRRAWDVAAPLLLRGRDTAVGDLQRGATNGGASFDSREILERSRNGDVGTLYLAADEAWRILGARYTGLDVDALGRAVNNVVRTAGEVCLVRDRMPHGAPMAALFRY